MQAGDKAALARLISLVEEESPQSAEIMGLIGTPSRYTFRVGITGMGGSGKSTLIDRLVVCYRNKGLSVGVISVDPTSLVSGGALLGDRIRMQQHYLDKGVFIRSMATRGSYGGLCKAVDNTLKLLEASQKDIILIETTGVGQTETDIVRVADLVVVGLVPDYGDSIQLMKGDLIAISDIVVINKADRPEAEMLANAVREELAYSPKKEKQSVMITRALGDAGIEELFEEIERRRMVKDESG